MSAVTSTPTGLSLNSVSHRTEKNLLKTASSFLFRIYGHRVYGMILSVLVLGCNKSKAFITMWNMHGKHWQEIGGFSEI